MISQHSNIFKSSFTILFTIITIPLYAFDISNSDSLYQNAIAECHKFISKDIKKSKTAGLSVAVVDNNRIVYSEGFGYASMEENKKVSDSTTFRVGSVTKLFTATAIMQLVEQGLISLNAPITDYLPDFKINDRFNSKPITVRHLLTHQSGLPSDIYNGWSIGQIYTPESDTSYRVAPSILANEYTAYPPEKLMSYCNIAFSLLGMIIENVSKQNYQNYIQQHIFNKLNMQHSSFNHQSANVRHCFSKGYFGKETHEPFYIRDKPAGSLVSSASDLSKFLSSLFIEDDSSTNAILHKTTLEDMWTAQNLNNPYDTDTLGLTYWLTNTTRIPVKIVSHGGDIPPYHAMLAAIPDSKLGVVVLVNSEQGNQLPTKVAIKLLESFYEAKTGNTLPEPAKAEKLPKVELTDEKLNEFAGLYTTNNDLTKAEIKRGKIRFNLFGKNVFLRPESDSSASVIYKLLGIIPVHMGSINVKMRTIDEHQLAIVESDEYKFTLKALKYIPKPPYKEWIDRCGTYKITNEKEVTYINDEIKERYKSTDLILSFDSLSNDLQLNGVPIKSISSNEALIRGLGRGAGETIRAYKENGEEYLWAWGFALKKITQPQ